MSEKKYTHVSHEHAHKGGEVPNHDNEKLDELIEKGRDARNEHAEKLDDIRHEAKAEALSRDEILSAQTEKDPPAGGEATGLINKELKGMAYSRTMTRIRKDLPLPERAFSRIIHNRAVESVSELGAKTLARPSGVLMGGLFAFVGSSVFLWVSKYYGYEYNFLMFSALFIAGFFLGLALEFLFRLFKKPPRS